MSGGTVCSCKPKNRDNWEVWQYKCNHSAFNGYRKTSSDYSQIRCVVCGHTWRTKAKYVEHLKFAK